MEQIGFVHVRKGQILVILESAQGFGVFIICSIL